MSRRVSPPPPRPHPAPPSERVTQAADACALGAYTHTLRVQRDRDGRALGNSIGCGLGALLLLAVTVVTGPGTPFTIITVIAVVVLLLVVALEVPSIAQVRRVGPAWAHLFHDGAVLERAAAGLLVLPTATSSVDHVTWLTGGDAGTTRHTALILAPPDGPAVILEARGRREGPVLAEIAIHYGQPSTPVAIETTDPVRRAGYW